MYYIYIVYYIYICMYHIYMYSLYVYICIIYIIMHVPEGTYSKIPPSTGWFITPSSYTGMSQNRYDRLLDEHPSRRDNRVLIHSRTAINPSWIYDPRNVVGIYPGFYTSWFPHHFEVSNLSIFFRVAIYSINPNSCHQLGHRWISPLGWGSNGLQHHLRYLEADLSQRSLNGKVMIYIDSSLDLDGILILRQMSETIWKTFGWNIKAAWKCSTTLRLCVNLLEDTPYTPPIKYETQERPSQVVN